ncbi:hypothetical protein N879_13905 [Alcaligenes sp. EGD-AK7]|nr:hypothetical protein N879_13905 [Alcaligenes sp. EGD-AK7]
MSLDDFATASRALGEGDGQSKVCLAGKPIIGWTLLFFYLPRRPAAWRLLPFRAYL